MATTTVKAYGLLPLALFNKEIDYLDDVIKVALTNSSHVPDQDAHNYYDDLTNQVSGTGYTAGGATLANKTIGYTAGTNVVKLDADDVVWSLATLSDVKNIHIYDDTPGTAATKPLIGYGVLNSSVAPAAGDLTLTFDTAGILTFTAA